MDAEKRADRRVARTQALVLGAFYELIVERGYDGFTVRDLIDRADVGRSTFYEHFENKDDVFERSVSAPLSGLVHGLFAAAPGDALRVTLEHFWDQRALARAIFGGQARFVMERVFARLILEALERRDAVPAELPPALAARGLAAAQLGVIGAWVEGQAPCEAAVLARALHASATASLVALFKQTTR